MSTSFDLREEMDFVTDGNMGRTSFNKVMMISQMSSFGFLLLIMMVFSMADDAVQQNQVIKNLMMGLFVGIFVFQYVLMGVAHKVFKLLGENKMSKFITIEDYCIDEVRNGTSFEFRIFAFRNYKKYNLATMDTILDVRSRDKVEDVEVEGRKPDEELPEEGSDSSVLTTSDITGGEEVAEFVEELRNFHMTTDKYSRDSKSFGEEMKVLLGKFEDVAIPETSTLYEFLITETYFPSPGGDLPVERVMVITDEEPVIDFTSVYGAYGVKSRNQMIWKVHLRLLGWLQVPEFKSETHLYPAENVPIFSVKTCKKGERWPTQREVAVAALLASIGRFNMFNKKISDLESQIKLFEVNEGQEEESALTRAMVYSKAINSTGKIKVERKSSIPLSTEEKVVGGLKYFGLVMAGALAVILLVSFGVLGG